MLYPVICDLFLLTENFSPTGEKRAPQLATCAECVDDTGYNPQALTPIAPATAEATAMMILRITSQVDFFMMLIFYV